MEKENNEKRNHLNDIPDIEETMKIHEHIKEEIAMVVPDWGDYAFMQIDLTTRQIFYNISEDCPTNISRKIEKIIQENANLIGISATTKRGQ